MSGFAEFHLPDDRRIFVRRSAVTLVYDKTEVVPVAFNEGKFQTAVEQATAAVHTETTGLTVPYTAQQVMEILYGSSE